VVQIEHVRARLKGLSTGVTFGLSPVPLVYSLIWTKSQISNNRHYGTIDQEFHADGKEPHKSQFCASALPISIDQKFCTEYGPSQNIKFFPWYTDFLNGCIFLWLNFTIFRFLNDIQK
jgi:hypothetical protein